VTDQSADKLAAVDDAAERALRAGELIDEHQSAIGELSRIRREAIEELVAAGKSQTEVAKLIGMTRSRVGQLLSSGPQPERAFLGTGTLTVAIGGKIEADKEDPGVVVSEGGFAAFERLAKLAQSLGLKAESEIIPPQGIVNLNRPNLVVVCGPRLSPIVAQVLESDPHLQFAKDDDGWYLKSATGDMYRSPADTGENSDIAYIGRLRRPDGKGTFLYMAGIHAAGTAGAAHYIEHNLVDLYGEVKTRGFSTLIRADYSQGLAITDSKQITSTFRHDGP
jgi:hypothetical protein